jgi:hypothetical protein
MISVRNIVVDAYKFIGAIADHEALDGTRTAVGVQLLNDIVSGYNLDNFFAFAPQEVKYFTSASQESYTIGVAPTSAYASADIVAERPSNIMRAYFRYKDAATPIEINQVATQDLNKFAVSNIAIGAPVFFSYTSEYPYGRLRFNVKPFAGVRLDLIYTKNFPTFDINDIAAIPPEYEPALKYSLAYLIACRYGTDADTVTTCKMLRDEACTRVKKNTMTKTPLVHMMQESAWGNKFNIMNFGI